MTLIDTFLGRRAGATDGQVSRDGAQLGGAPEAETGTETEIGSADDLGIGMLTGLDAGAAAGAAGETEVGMQTGRGREVGAAARMTGEKGARGETGVEVEIGIGSVREIGRRIRDTGARAEARAERERGVEAQRARGPEESKSSGCNRRHLCSGGALEKARDIRYGVKYMPRLTDIQHCLQGELGYLSNVIAVYNTYYGSAFHDTTILHILRN